MPKTQPKKPGLKIKDPALKESARNADQRIREEGQRRGRPPGSGSDYTAKVYASVTPEQKKELERRALARRHTEDLPARWGVSDLVRELIEAYLSRPA